MKLYDFALVAFACTLLGAGCTGPSEDGQPPTVSPPPQSETAEIRALGRLLTLQGDYAYSVDTSNRVIRCRLSDNCDEVEPVMQLDFTPTPSSFLVDDVESIALANAEITDGRSLVYKRDLRTQETSKLVTSPISALASSGKDLIYLSNGQMIKRYPNGELQPFALTSPLANGASYLRIAGDLWITWYERLDASTQAEGPSVVQLQTWTDETRIVVGVKDLTITKVDATAGHTYILARDINATHRIYICPRHVECGIKAPSQGVHYVEASVVDADDFFVVSTNEVYYKQGDSTALGVLPSASPRTKPLPNAWQKVDRLHVDHNTLYGYSSREPGLPVQRLSL